MSSKAQIIILIIVLLIIVISVVSVYIYINKLNKTINEMSTTIANQSHEINALKCNIESLNKEIDSLDDVISITDGYISNVSQIKDEDTSIKQVIYEQVISNEEVRDWFSESLPNDILSAINSSANTGMCKDSN